MRTRTTPNSIGQTRDLVRFETPGDPVSDGQGGFTYNWAEVTPSPWYVRMRPATARDAEHLTAGTILTHQSYLVHGRYHPGVTTAARMVDGADRVYQITSVVDLDHRGEEMELVADLQG